MCIIVCKVRDVGVIFRTRWEIGVFVRNLRGGQCNLPKIYILVEISYAGFAYAHFLLLGG